MPSVSQSLQDELASTRAEAERFRQQAQERAGELSELRSLLGEAELRRDEARRLLQQMRAQDRLIAQLRPQAASNRLALQALRRLQHQREAGAPKKWAAVSALSASRWFKSIRRLLRGKAGRAPT